MFSNVKTSPSGLSNTGTYDGLNNLPVVMNKIVYNPFYSVLNPLWSFSKNGKTYSFELATLTISPNKKNMFGTGTLKATGFDDTPGIWEYSSQIAHTFSAGAESLAPPVNVSEPATLALLGLGLAGIGFSRRKPVQTI